MKIVPSTSHECYRGKIVGSVRRKCSRKLILFCDRHLQRLLSNYAAHFNQDRPHPSLDNLIAPTIHERPGSEKVVVDERLGGLLRSYRRTA